MPQDKGHDSAVPIVYIPPIAPIDNERPLDAGGSRITMPVVQPIDNERQSDTSGNRAMMPTVQPVDNEQEGDITIPLVDLQETRSSVEDEKDTGIGVQIIIAPPVQPIDNERPLDIGVRSGGLSPVQPVDNSKESEIVIPIAMAPPIQGTDNSKEAEIAVPVTLISPIKPIDSDPIKNKIIPLTGKLITSDDPIVIGQNFKSYINLRPTPTHPRAIGGMSKVNSANVMDATYLKTRSAYHLVKEQPAESHVLVQAFATALTTSAVLDNITAIGTVGDFVATDVWTDTGAVEVAQWSEATEGQVAYCNGTDTCIWGGSELRCARYINFDVVASGFSYDFTDLVSNNKTTEVATFTLDSGSNASVYIGSLRPLKGIKFYVGTANANAATAAVSYWDGDSWEAVTGFTDGTISVAGKTLSGTGTMVFATTVSIAKTKYVEGSYLYYYKILFTGINAATTVYYATLDAPFQRIVDIWDGVDRNIGLLYLYKTNYIDYTLNVYQDIYDSNDVTTFIELDSLANTEYLVIGFTERMSGINILTAPTSVNGDAATVTVSYWNGAAWATVGTVTDGTLEGGVSLAKPGIITWHPPASTLEFRKTIDNGIPLYYYKVIWSAALDADTQIYYVSGVPAQNTIDNYRFPLYTQNRLLLCGNVNRKKNVAIFSSIDSSQVFNGMDSGELEFGDETALTCGCSLFTQFGSNLYNVSILYKNAEMWILTYIEDRWIRYKISDTIGCPAPGTLRTIVTQPSETMPNLNRYVAIWQGTNGIYVSDGRSPILISKDIQDRFDRASSTCINTAYLRKSYGFIDEHNQEYHWLYCNGTPGDATNPLNKEMVFSFREWKWYEIERTAAKYLQCGLTVHDTYGNALTHGFIDTGYMEALEWLNATAGTIKTLDGTDITCTLETGDVLMEDGKFFTETRLVGSMLIALAKTTTVNNATMSHYVDTSTTAYTSTFDPTSASHRISFPVKVESSVPGVLHSFKLVMIANDESIAFEPLALNLLYKEVREHDYEKNW